MLSGWLFAVGCDVTPDQIATWKTTERGPKKLRDALARSSLKPAIRGQALAALVELGMTNEALGELQKSPDGERREVVHEAVPRLGELSGARAQAAPGTPTTRVQREAKDALFSLRDLAAEADKNTIDDLLIAWTTADLAARMDQGGHSTEKMLTAIGMRATPRLIELLRPGSPDLSPAASLLGKLADPPTRARSADALVQVLRKSAAATQNDAVLQALGRIGGPHATAYLVEQAERGPERSRELALLALAQGKLDPGDSAALTAGLRVAADKSAPGKVREAAFQLTEKIGAAAVPGLIKLLDAPEDLVRWRSVEAALAAGKAEAIVPVLEGMSPARSYKPEDLDSYVVHDLKAIGAPALAPLKQELKSKNWVARAVAVRTIAQLGKADDAGELSALEADATKLKGFPGNATLGSEAKAAVVALRAKR